MLRDTCSLAEKQLLMRDSVVAILEQAQACDWRGWGREVDALSSDWGGSVANHRGRMHYWS